MARKCHNILDKYSAFPLGLNTKPLGTPPLSDFAATFFNTGKKLIWSPVLTEVQERYTALGGTGATKVLSMTH